MMRHSQSLKFVLRNLVEVPSVLDMQVAELSADSRAIRPGDAFVALPDAEGDTGRYLDDAVAHGAVAVIRHVDGPAPVHEYKGTLVVPVPGLTERVAELAELFYDYPSTRLNVIGVTGTNGKTSVTQFLTGMLNHCGQRTASIGTLGYGFPGAMLEASHTTPDVIRVHRLLARFLEKGADNVVMEVSSHGLDQGRVDRVHFSGGIFTNLARDHLDYHSSLAAYGEAKAKLFRDYGLCFAVLNGDDSFSGTLYSYIPSGARCWRYSVTGQSAEFAVVSITPASAGFTAEVETPSGALTLESRLMGMFNLANLIAACAGCAALGVDLEQIGEAARAVEAPPGRMETFQAADGRRLVIDYAHTADALEAVLEALRPHVAGQLWCVFGCGGDRDTSKRPMMGAVAERLADQVVITDDNPRSEAPESIVDQILAGMNDAGAAEVEHDRARAIALAFEQSGPHDLVLVAGKGHERFQERQGEKLPFSDLETVRKMIAETGGAA